MAPGTPQSPGSAQVSVLAKAFRPLPARRCAARCPPWPPRSADSSLASDRQEPTLLRRSGSRRRLSPSIEIDDISLACLCKNHKFRTTKTWLIFLGFLCAKDRCVVGPRRGHDDTRTDGRSRVAAHVHGRTNSPPSMSLCTEPAAVPPPRMPRALPWMAPPSPGSPEKRAGTVGEPSSKF